MNYIGTYLFPILIDIVHIKVLSNRTVQLYRNHRVFFAVYILCLDINLRSIKGRFPFRFHERKSIFHQNLPQRSLRLLPVRLIPQIFLCIVRIPLGQTVSHILLKAQRSKHIICQIQTAFQLILHLIWTDYEMSLRNRELPYSRQAMHFTGVFVPKQSGCFPVTNRQIPVGMLTVFIAIILEWTCHRTKGEHFPVLLFVSQDKHPFFVMIPVT